MKPASFQLILNVGNIGLLSRDQGRMYDIQKVYNISQEAQHHLSIHLSIYPSIHSSTY